MSYGDQVQSAGVHRTIIIQGILTAITAALFLAFGASHHALGALYGGLIAIIIATLLGWRLKRAANFSADEQKERGGLQLAVGALERFLVVGVGFAVGIALLKLPPVAMIAAFAIAQISFLIRVPTRVDSKHQPSKNRGVAP